MKMIKSMIGQAFWALAVGSTIWGTPACAAHPKVQTFNWDGTEVVWVEDARFPTFVASIYFDYGAAAENPAQRGITAWALSEITDGTKQYTQKELASNLEYYGIGHTSNVNQEFALFNFWGAVKFLPQTVAQICHLFKAANYPAQELANTKKKAKRDLNNMATNPSAVVNQMVEIFWGQGTPWANPVGGRWATFQKFKGPNLQNHLQFLREKVKKKIYISGPSEVLAAQEYFKACGFKGDQTWNFASATPVAPAAAGKPQITFVALPQSNQAQIMLGGWRGPIAVPDLAAADLANSFLGGHNFKTQLMQEIRVKHGLTYGIYSYVNFGRHFSQVLIETSGRTEKVGEILQRTIQKLNELQEGVILPEELALTRTGFAREKIFDQETAVRYLRSLVIMEYLGGKITDLENYAEQIKKVERPQVVEFFKQAYGPQLQIAVVGHPSLKKELAKIGTVREVKLKDLW